MIRRFERTLLIALCVAVGAFYAWTVRSGRDRWKWGKEQEDYYNLLIDGYLDGQLHMKVAVPPELLRLPNPYDPKLRPAGLGLHDASFYKGKYYVYFGAAPMVILMLPFRLLTGGDLPLAVATFLFVYGGFLASVALWWALRRRYFPKTSASVALGFIPVLGFASLGPVLLRRPEMWELPIGAGYCFAMLALGGLWRSVHAVRRAGELTPTRARAGWFFAAALALGLAIASRPTYLLALPLLTLPLVFWWRVERRFSAGVAWSAFVPLAIVGAAMAWHNYARFDDPLQFGQAYQLSHDYESKMAHFQARYVAFNGWRYFFSAAQWSPYFPFIQPAALPVKPTGFGGHDDVYGILTNLPIAWLVLALPLALWRRERAERVALGAWLAAGLTLFLTMAGILLFFFGSLARYQIDFTPALILLAGVGGLALERWMAASGFVVGRAGARGLVWLAGIASVGFALLNSLQLDGLLVERNPRIALEVARALNRVPASWAYARGLRYGAAEFSVQFHPNLPGRHEIIAVGDPSASDHVRVNINEDGQAQWGFAQSATPELWSRPFPLEYAREYRVRATLGSLFPPREHPFFAGQADSEIERITRTVRLEVDGETVLAEQRRFSRVGGEVRAVEGAAVSVSAVRRVSAAAKNPGPRGELGDGWMRLRLSFPEQAPTPREPLLAIGDDGSGAVLFVHYIDDTGRLAFGVSFRGERSAPGGTLRVDLGRVHDLVARWWSIGEGARRGLEIRLDHVIVYRREVNWPERDGAIAAGRNPFSEPGCAPLFTGKMHQIQRSADGRDPLGALGDTFKLRVNLGTGRPGTLTPLLVMGRPGGADLVMLEYGDAGTVRFALDHWGSALFRSDPVRLDPTRSHEISLSLSSLLPPVAARANPSAARGRLRLDVDGERVWEQAAELFTVPAEEVYLGFNPVGGTSGGPIFLGDILAVERLRRAAPSP